ncbi:FecR family protein [Methylomicrobium album]|uniref:Fe2+-dicitrate sensor, membrane component n=1 Tax=Methylomicrobium album BG8 TaxID=686340 RepID=H8GKD1_METAL|nr:FecR family protein [Methylomicrobium album]EIC30422.1 Fe2+-dicitrate sensor, membrane component [Methylomicrobium album BG8]
MESELNDNIDEQAVAWFIRLRADNVSNEDRKSFDRWLEQAADHRRAFDEVCAMWGDTALLNSLRINAKLHRITPKPPKKRYLNPKIALALAACLVLAVPLAGRMRILLRADYTSAMGERKTVLLEDGSTAMLNTDSAIAVNMKDGKRSVELFKGEVFFDVKPDPSRPFLVRADHSTTRVLGTRFFVNHRKESDEIKVLSGRVEVSDSQIWKDPVVLGEDEAVTVYEASLGHPRKLDSKLSTSWINGFLVYENETLEALVEAINRYRPGMVFFKDASLRQLKINGRLSIRESHDMLKVLQRTMGIKMTYVTDWVVIIG